MKFGLRTNYRISLSSSAVSISSTLSSSATMSRSILGEPGGGRPAPASAAAPPPRPHCLRGLRDVRRWTNSICTSRRKSSGSMTSSSSVRARGCSTGLPPRGAAPSSKARQTNTLRPRRFKDLRSATCVQASCDCPGTLRGRRQLNPNPGADAISRQRTMDRASKRTVVYRTPVEWSEVLAGSAPLYTLRTASPRPRRGC